MADAFDGEEVVDAFEGAVGFAGVEDFLGGGGADAWDFFELIGGGGVEIYWMGGRFLFGEGGGEGECQENNDGEKACGEMAAPEHWMIMAE